MEKMEYLTEPAEEQELNDHNRGTWGSGVPIVFVSLCVFALIVHLLTHSGAGKLGLIVSSIATLVLWFVSRRVCIPGILFVRVVAGLALGFVAFNIFRYLGFVSWPLERVENAREFTFLLISHVVLVAFVLAGVLWAAVPTGQATPLARYFPLGKINWLSSCLIGVSAIIWLWVFWTVWHKPINAPGVIWCYVSIAFIKACITGFGEEACYRGILQKCASDSFGPVWGIILQAILYATFHIHLGAAFINNRILFLPGLFLFGVILGIFTHKAKSILPACIIHSALDMIIEWGNII